VSQTDQAVDPRSGQVGQAAGDKDIQSFAVAVGEQLVAITH
jgi:hypothetical protein